MVYDKMIIAALAIQTDSLLHFAQPQRALKLQSSSGTAGSMSAGLRG